MTSKVPTPQGISALLRKAGFEKSVTGLRGGSSAGFHVHRHPAIKEVAVNYWWPMSSVPVAQQRRTERQMLTRYAEAIRAAGWHVYERQNLDYLIVTAPKEG